MGHLKRRVIFLAVLLVVAFALLLVYGGRTQRPESYYLSGMLVFGQRNGCGLIPVAKIDRFSCQLPEEFCDDHREFLNKRIRISAEAVQCSNPSAFRCAQGSVDFYEDGFDPNRCYIYPSFISVLKR